MTLLNVPLLGDGLSHFLLLHLFYDVLTRLPVPVDDSWPHEHLELLFRHAINGVPQLSVWLLGLVWVFEVKRALKRELVKHFRFFNGHLPCVLSRSLVDGLIRLELDHLSFSLSV